MREPNSNPDTRLTLFSGHVDEKLPTPLYHQIYMILRDKIMSGTFAANTLIPSEHELGKVFKVSRITAKRALDELATEGLVTRHRGRGTRVTHVAASSSVTGNVEGLLENLLMMGLETEVELLGFGYVQAPPRAAEALGIDIGSLVQHAVRVRKKDGLPFSYLVTYVPEAIGRSFSQDDLVKKPLLALLERSGVAVKSARQAISAALADSKTAPALGISIGAALLKISRVAFDAAGRPVEYIVSYYRPDLYQLNLNLSRVAGTTTNTWSTAT